MTIGAPGALWGLLAIPALIVLYLLRVRRRDYPVGSVFLWQRSAPTLAAYRPARRIERSLLLLLQCLAVAAVVAALVRPSVVARRGLPGDVMLVMDLSLSMRARDVRPTRFEVARADALAVLSGLRGGQRAALVSAGPHPDLVVPLTADLGAVRRGLQGLTPWDAAGDVAAAVRFAAEHPLGPRGRILVWTDSARGPLAALPSVSYRVLGSSDDNVGITAFRISRDPRVAEALLRVQNFSGSARRLPVSVSRAGQTVYRQIIDLPPGAGRTLVFPVTEPGVYEARVDARDILPDDDVAFAVLDPSPLPSTLLVSSGNPYLERLLRVLPVGKAAVTRSTNPGDWGGFGVVILDRVDPGPLPPGDYLLIRSVPANLPVTATGEVARPDLAVWEREDPILRFVDLDDVAVSRALALTTRGGRVLAGGDVPLVWAYQGAGVRAVLLGFALQDTDLVERPAFPVLIANSLAWLGGQLTAVDPGARLQLPASGGASAELIDPERRRRTISPVGGVLALPSLTQAGVYELRSGGQSRFLTVPPAPAPAGAVRPRGAIPGVLPTDRGVTNAPAGTRLPVWPWALAFGLAAATAEWTLATRRRGGDA